jgi:non-specific serine/threonine protein kinase
VEIGRGGMGVVWRGWDTRLHRAVALKSLDVLARDPRALAGLEQEARAMAAISHPNVAIIHGIEEAEGRPWLVMELVEGPTLAERLHDGALPLHEALRTCEQVAAAMEAAHARRVIHRDLKPGNVKVTSAGVVKVLDFGLARARPGPGDVPPGEGWSADGADLPLGTPGYMSPEQVRGEPLDEATDTWALGCILYECLTGRIAYDGSTVAERLAATLRDVPDWALLPPSVQRPVRDVLQRLLRRERDERLRDAGEARRRLSAAATTQPVVRAPGRRGNLPRPLSSFLGRAREREEVKRLVQQSRLVTLTGAGGCGKTRLALKVAEELAAEMGGGAWLVELAPVVDPAHVPVAVATTLGVEDDARVGVAAALAGHVGSEKLLLVLDTCEHVLSACAELVAALLAACPRLRVLATSRENLGVPGEILHGVPPLAAPAGGDDLTLAELVSSEAAQLFIERARAVRPGFEVTEAEVPHVARICRRLDGLPLPLELAAARTKVLSVAQVAARLDDGLRLLTGGSRTAMPRHQTLRAAMDWSCNLLSEAEQTLYRRLSVFAGGFTLEAAESACAGGAVPPDAVLDTLTRLVHASLVMADEHGGEVRYRLLDTVRQHASESLRDAGEAEWVRRAHRDAFLALAEQLEGHARAPDQAAWLERMERERDNLRAAFEWSLDDPDGVRAALRLAVAWLPLFDVRGHWREGREALEAALARARAGGSVPRTQLASALNAAGRLARRMGDLGLARERYEEALELYRETGNREAIASVLNNLGTVALARGDLDTARVLHAESLAIKRDLGDAAAVAVSLTNLGTVERARGDLGRARDLHEESLTIRRQLADARGVAQSLNNLGTVAAVAGDLAAARACHEESLLLRRRLGDKNGTVMVLVNLGLVGRAEGRLAEARTMLQEALLLSRELGSREGQAHALAGLGRVAQAAGDRDEAAAAHREALRLFATLGEREGLAAAMSNLGTLLGTSSVDAARGVELLGASRALCEATGLRLAAVDAEDPAPALEAARAILGDDGVAAALARGHAARTDDVVAAALAGPPSGPRPSA